MRVCAHLGSFWTHRRHVHARVSLCILYVPITGHHVTCQDSRVQDEVVVFFFLLLLLLVFPRVGSSPERRALPARISAPRCVTTTEAAVGGWEDGRTDVAAELRALQVLP